MKRFYTYITDFLKEDFNIGYYSATAIFIVVAISINYSIDLEDGILDKLPTTFLRFLAFTGLYVAAYTFILLLNQIFYPKNSFLRDRWLWMAIIFGFSVLSFDTALHTYPYFDFLPRQLSYYIPKVFNNLLTLITYLLPLWIYYKFIDSPSESFYGMTAKGFDLKPYLQLFLIIIPIVAIASFHENFNTYYPMYKNNGAAEYLNINEVAVIAGYELSYGWSFVSVELLFRGFLVVGLIKIMGRHVILPMVVLYCFIHFGKPIGECISSVFGGYILGIIAYYSRSIWGGILIHIGLAWLMELFASFHSI